MPSPRGTRLPRLEGPGGFPGKGERGKQVVFLVRATMNVAFLVGLVLCWSDTQQSSGGGQAAGNNGGVPGRMQRQQP